MSAHNPFAPTARVGPYEIASRLGRGFVSEVWLAYRPAGDGRMQAMALKRLHHPAPALQTSFGDALRQAAILDHPNVVHVFSSFQHGEQSVGVVELVDGLSVAELIDDRRRRDAKVEPKLAVWIARECLRAAYDVQAQVTGAGSEHGHMRASNVLLSREGVVKVSDFALARVTNDRRLVGDLAREPERDAVSIARLLLAMWLGQSPAALPADQLESAAVRTGAASVATFVRRCLAKDSTERLRDLEEDLGRLFYAELGARELEDGTPALAALVRGLMPAVEAERAQRDAEGFKPFPRETLSATRTIANKASFGLTDLQNAREQPVVPSPLTIRDIPTGFTRDLALDSGAHDGPADAEPSRSGSEAPTDEDLPAPPPAPPKPRPELLPPTRPPGAERRPPPPQSSTSNPGRSSKTQSSEFQLPWFQGATQFVLGVSVGVFLTAVLAFYYVSSRAETARIEPQPSPPPAPVVSTSLAEVPEATEPAAGEDLEARLVRLGALAPGSEGRRSELTRAAEELARELAEARVDAQTRRRVERLIAEGLERQDPAALTRALRSLRNPRAGKLAPVESL